MQFKLFALAFLICWDLSQTATTARRARTGLAVRWDNVVSVLGRVPEVMDLFDGKTTIGKMSWAQNLWWF